MELKTTPGTWLIRCPRVPKRNAQIVKSRSSWYLVGLGKFLADIYLETTA
jgi:hypothetical protein